MDSLAIGNTIEDLNEKLVTLFLSMLKPDKDKNLTKILACLKKCRGILREMREGFDRITTDSEQMRRNCEDALKGKKDRIRDLEKKLVVMECENEDLQEQVERLERESRLQNSYDNLIKYFGAVEKLEKKLETFEEKLESPPDENELCRDVIDKQISRFTETLKEYKKDYDAQLKKEAEKNQREMNKVNGELEKLRENRNEMEKQKKENEVRLQFLIGIYEAIVDGGYDVVKVDANVDNNMKTLITITSRFGKKIDLEYCRITATSKGEPVEFVFPKGSKLPAYSTKTIATSKYLNRNTDFKWKEVDHVDPKSVKFQIVEVNIAPKVSRGDDEDDPPRTTPRRARRKGPQDVEPIAKRLRRARNNENQPQQETEEDTDEETPQGNLQGAKRGRCARNNRNQPQEETEEDTDEETPQGDQHRAKCPLCGKNNRDQPQQEAEEDTDEETNSD